LAHRHSHDHGHEPGVDRRSLMRRLGVALGLVVVYAGAEVVGGLVTNSLALLADAGHMLSDAAALGLSLFALWIAARPADDRRTYGYHRTEILAALANGAALVGIALYVMVEAIQRLRQPPEVDGGPMALVAVGGLVVNLAALAVLHRGRSASLNLRGAWLHVVGDTLGSVQAIAAGLAIVAFDWRWADPVASIAISLLIGWSSWSLLRDSVAVLMESAPGHLDVDEVRAAIAGEPGVQGVHDLHVWTITSGRVCLSAHVVVEADHRSGLLARIREMLESRFGIGHLTLQLEPADFAGCEDCGRRVASG
jgi:cobalt-zinc-cadmium efflux system protein